MTIPGNPVKLLRSGSHKKEFLTPHKKGGYRGKKPPGVWFYASGGDRAATGLYGAQGEGLSKALRGGKVTVRFSKYSPGDFHTGQRLENEKTVSLLHS